MAIEAFSRAHPRTWIDDAALLAFLLLAFVGLSPFSPPPPEVLSFGGVETTGAGDLARQICYLAVFAAAAISALNQRGLAAFSPLPLLLLVLVAWCVASALWSAEPGVTVRRAGLAMVLVVTAMLSVEAAGAGKSLALWRWVLLAILVVNIASVRFVPAAVHLPGESDVQLVGAWRGLYGHKNIAGSVGAMTAILFLFSPRSKGWHKLLDIAVAAAAVGFTVMTRSKSSLGLVAVAALAGGIYRLAWRREIDRTIAVAAGALVAIAAAVLVIVDETAIMRIFADPEQFTGRTEIWNAEVAFIRDHLVYGAGFGTFSNTGGISPLHNYVGGWAVAASHGHNGYLQILVTLGAIGFVLAMASLVAVPAAQLWRRGDVGLKAPLFALFVFLLLHNLMETDFLEGDGVTWVAYLMMLAMLGNLSRTERAP